MMAYLAMMAVRLIELHRVLKPTGSLYLHCDPTASHYLKILLDAVFGKEFYRAEIIWKRTNARGRALGAIQGHRPKAAAIKPDTSKRPEPFATRAIRTGWSIGEVAFTYEDSTGEVSYRTVTAHSVSATYLKGECHDRQAERTFRIDRIIGDLTDCETGEILSPKKWARRHT